MWLFENIKLHIWLFPVACLLFPLDSASLESEAKIAYGAWNQTALPSKPNPVLTSIVNKDKQLNPCHLQHYLVTQGYISQSLDDN